jgi:hypothetical protein
VPPRTTVAENRDFRPLKGVFGKNLLKSKNLSQNTGFFVTPKFFDVYSIKYALKAILCLILRLNTARSISSGCLSTQTMHILPQKWWFLGSLERHWSFPLGGVVAM